MEMDSHTPRLVLQASKKNRFTPFKWGFCAMVAVLMGCEAAQKPQLPTPRPSASSITLETSPAGARMTIDGIIVGPSPITVTLNPGPHLVKAALTGYFPVEQKIQVPSKTQKTVQLTLVASH